MSSSLDKIRQIIREQQRNIEEMMAVPPEFTGVTAKQQEESKLTYEDILEAKELLDSYRPVIAAIVRDEKALDDLIEEYGEDLLQALNPWGLNIFYDPDMGPDEISLYFDKHSLSARLRRIK